MVASAKKPQTPAVLFVCTGNICRSPAAEYIARHLLQQQDLRVETASAGTHAGHGSPMSREMLVLLEKKGIYGGDFFSRPISSALLRKHDLVLIMEQMHREYILQCFGPQPGLYFLADMVDGCWEWREIDDPYGGTMADYEQSFDILWQAISRMVANGFYGLL